MQSMIPRPLRQFLVETLHRLGYELHRTQLRSTLLGSLRQSKLAGLAPATVLDVGAAWGTFTQACQSVFPDARYILIEPLTEYQTALEALKSKQTGLEVVMAAAAPKAGEVIVHVHPDLGGTSMFLEQDVAGVNGVPRTVRAVCLDNLAAQLGLAGPFLIKLDVQGAELAVLDGATNVLRLAEYVLLEVSLFEFFEGGSLLADVIQYMLSRGFVAYDAFGWQYRPLDGALSQLDIAFVREHGQLRTRQAFATEEQRQAQWTASPGRR